MKITPPKAAVKKIVDSLLHPNWKLPTRVFTTSDMDLACEVGDALDFYLGGHECKVITYHTGAHYELKSRGYYHYVGA
jgi:hypothetical protein